ncbi:MAG TPA: response regulator transcription factor [Candidatus Dormibacteraeota bacterium]|nr:response regulator transcription factor [Candidatus Dormibacteraeota bacterium]
MASVLVLDGDPLQLELTALLLARDDHRPLTTGDPEKAFEILETEQVELVLFDISLPRHDGYRVGQQIRHQRPGIPLAVVSDRVEQEQVVRCLLAFADDFINKPFAPREMLARVHSLLRRAGLTSGARAADGSLVVGEIALNRQLMKASIRGADVPLTPRELTLLSALMSNPNRVLSRGQLIRLAWGDDFTGCLKTVDVCIQRLRKKMEPHLGSAPQYIQAVRGFGYKLEAVSRQKAYEARRSRSEPAPVATANTA